jgi:hypothetical protein
MLRKLRRHLPLAETRYFLLCRWIWRAPPPIGQQPRSEAHQRGTFLWRLNMRARYSCVAEFRNAWTTLTNVARSLKDVQAKISNREEDGASGAIGAEKPGVKC